MTFQEIHRLDKSKIQTLKGLISRYDESFIASLRQSPEERKARIEAHKQRYKISFMEVLEKARENRWARTMKQK